MRRTLILAFVWWTLPVRAVEMYSNFPEQIHSAERYVIYSHGLIVEGDDSRPVHPEFGVYDFPAIRNALFDGGGFNLIAHHRPKNADVAAYADTLESWVKRLVSGGVAPSRITLIGFSRGAQLTAMASSRLRQLGINTALMGVCVKGDFTQTPPVQLGGRVLSIYETTDVVGSCAQLARRSELVSFEEVAITTGKKHGAFYQPTPEWMAPLKAWVARTSAPSDTQTRSTTRWSRSLGQTVSFRGDPEPPAWILEASERTQ